MKRFLAVVLLVALLLVPGTALATPPNPVGGAVIPTIPLDGTGYLDGGISGAYETEAYVGRVSKLSFSGYVEGVPCDMSINLLNLGKNGIGYWTILQSTCGVHGQGTWIFPPDMFPGSYEGQIHFDP